MYQGPQREIEERPQQMGVGRFVLGALAIVAGVALFLYADGYFEGDPLLPTAGGPVVDTSSG